MRLRPLSALLALALVGSPVLIASPIASAPAVAAPLSFESIELDFLGRLNAERTNRGLRALVGDTPLADTAHDWSYRMRLAGKISHDPGLAEDVARVEPSWRWAAENVGVGYSVKSLHDAFMASSGHQANILSSRANRAGVGVSHSADGRIWVTVRFLEGPTISGPTGPAPATAPAPPPPPPPPPAKRSALTGDFNGDGFDDVFAYGPGDERDELHLGRADGTFEKRSISVHGRYRPVAADFDGDGRTDIFWYGVGSHPDSIWRWNGDGFVGITTSVRGVYLPVAGDFDGDGYGDVMWYAPGLSGDSVWFGRPSAGQFDSGALRITGTYRPAVGDLDGDGRSDVVLHGPGTTPDHFFYGQSNGGFSVVRTEVKGSYDPVVGDFNGDHRADVFWYAAGSAPDSVWHATSTRGSFAQEARPVQGSYVPGADDFNADDVDDVLWFSPTSASNDPLWFGDTDGYVATTLTTS